MTAHDILNILSKQKFADWYNAGGRFDQYLSDGTISKADIIKDIEEMFGVVPIEDYWKPLLKVIDIKDIGDYMWMGFASVGNIQLYKHINTRKYINVDDKGNCFSYDTEQYCYNSITKYEAIKHVLS